MGNIHYNKKLFNEAGCLSMEGIQLFLSGGLKGHEIKLVESHIRSCPLCSDAIEGFRSTGDLEQSKNNISNINKKIQLRSKQNYDFEKRKKYRFYIPAAAASLIFLAGLFLIFKFTWFNPATRIAENRDIKNQFNEIATPKNKSIPDISKTEEKQENKVTLQEKKSASEILYTRKPEPEKTVKSAEFTNREKKDVTSSVIILSDDLMLEDIDTEYEASEVNIIPYEDEISLPAGTVASEKKSSRAMPAIMNEEEDSSPEEQVFFIVEEMPKFRNGDINSFIEYIQKNITYPEEAAESGIEGRVFVQFIVDSTGEVVNAKILRGVDAQLDSMVLKAIQSSPRWQPGKQRDIPVNVEFTIPITFKLN
ncbi:MAG: energy transducer TonB [Bacteroidales bacterium]|nr:energy transducer TonB [Bacteroidales bacterium]